MPGENIQDWSTTAVNNGTADSSINWAEGQPRASVNNSARSMMAAQAKQRNLLNGSITTSGTANVQAFTSGVSYTSVPTGLRVLLKIGAALTNTATATLNMDGIGAVEIKTEQGTSLVGGELVAGAFAEFLYDGTNWRLLYDTRIRAVAAGPTVTVYTGGTGTYTTPVGTIYLEVECIGGGGGGGAGADGGNGSTGNGTTFGAFTTNGGGGGTAGSNPGTGGSASGATLNLAGESGSLISNVGDTNTLPSGGDGGSSKYGGRGAGGFGTPGSAAVANTGSGGGGGGRTAASGYGGGGGGAGGYCWGIISSPAASYGYAVGAGGGGGAVGAAGHPGGAGAAGLIIVKAFP